MQGNSGFAKIVRTKPQAVRTPAPVRGKGWTRTDKRAVFSQK